MIIKNKNDKEEEQNYVDEYNVKEEGIVIYMEKYIVAFLPIVLRSFSLCCVQWCGVVQTP